MLKIARPRMHCTSRSSVKAKSEPIQSGSAAKAPQSPGVKRPGKYGAAAVVSSAGGFRAATGRRSPNGSVEEERRANED